MYECFLSEFASAKDKKGGQFYTPRCVVHAVRKTWISSLSCNRPNVTTERSYGCHFASISLQGACAKR